MPEEKYKIAKAEFKKKMLAELFKTKKALVNYENDIFNYTFDRAYSLGKQDKDAEETVIQGWIARDDGERWHERELHLFTRNKPERRKLMGDWIGRPSMTLDSNLFPDLTWDSDPIEVELIIKRKKK